MWPLWPQVKKVVICQLSLWSGDEPVNEASPVTSLRLPPQAEGFLQHSRWGYVEDEHNFHCGGMSKTCWIVAVKWGEKPWCQRSVHGNQRLVIWRSNTCANMLIEFLQIISALSSNSCPSQANSEDQHCALCKRFSNKLLFSWGRTVSITICWASSMHLILWLITID